MLDAQELRIIRDIAFRDLAILSELKKRLDDRIEHLTGEIDRLEKPK